MANIDKVAKVPKVAKIAKLLKYATPKGFWKCQNTSKMMKIVENAKIVKIDKLLR